MYLVDTNVWLELLLEQEKESEVRQFFQDVEARLLSITDFSLYSIGIILTKLKKDDAFTDFLSDTIEDSGVIRICLDTSDLKQLIKVRQIYQMDLMILINMLPQKNTNTLLSVLTATSTEPNSEEKLLKKCNYLMMF